MLLRKTKVVSSCIAAIAYNKGSAVLVRRYGALRIWFVNGGTYDYYGVPAHTVKRLLDSYSIGRTYNLLVRGRYLCLPVRLVRSKKKGLAAHAQ